MVNSKFEAYNQYMTQKYGKSPARGFKNNSIMPKKTNQNAEVIFKKRTKIKKKKKI